jgi:large subunit ribosomal protein L32
MAVQKSRVTRSRRGMRRAHDGLEKSALSVDAETGETHRRHHISPKGYYKGRLILSSSVETEEESDEE